MTHTPGPWDYDDINKEVFASCEEHESGWVALIAGNDSEDRPLPESMMLANARLIAAAPDLLEACTSALGTIQYLLSNSDNGPAENCLEVLAAAIAKAEGRAK